MNKSYQIIMLKFLLIIIAMSFLSLSSQAEIYRWVDEHRKVRYSDKPRRVMPSPAAGEIDSNPTETSAEQSQGEEGDDKIEQERKNQEARRRAMRLHKKQEKCARAHNALEKARAQLLERQRQQLPTQSEAYYLRTIEQRKKDMERNCS